MPPYFGLGNVDGGRANLDWQDRLTPAWPNGQTGAVAPLARRNSLSTGGNAGPGTNQSQASIRRHAESSDRAGSLADIQELAVPGDGEIERSSEGAGRGIEQAQQAVRRDALWRTVPFTAALKQCG